MFTSALILSARITRSWNRKLISLAGLTLLTSVLCSFLNLRFNTDFDSAQFNVVKNIMLDNVRNCDIHDMRTRQC